jgi:hypothetical protein
MDIEHGSELRVPPGSSCASRILGDANARVVTPLSLRIFPNPVVRVGGPMNREGERRMNSLNTEGELERELEWAGEHYRRRLRQRSFEGLQEQCQR